MAYLSACSTSGHIFIGLIAFAAGWLGLAWYAVLELAFLFVPYFYTLLRLRQVLLNVLKHKVVTEAQRPEDQAQKIQTDTPPAGRESEKIDTTISGFARMICQLLKEGFQTYFRPRKGYRRAYLILVAIVNLLYNSATDGVLHGPIIALYCTSPPLKWNAEEISYWKAMDSAVSICGKLRGA